MQRKRRGFTLVELLVVITIIGILAGLTLRAAVGILQTGRESATKSTMQKVQRLLDTRLNDFQRRYAGNDATTKERVKATAAWTVAGTMTSNGNPVNANQRLVLARKLLFRQWFPQSDSEVDRDGLFRDFPLGASNPEILYRVLNADQSDFLVQEFGDQDLNGLPCFVDAWGEPIKFYRWPTRLLRLDDDGDGADDQWPTLRYSRSLQISGLTEQRLQQDPNHPLLRDPMDPLGVCATVDNFVNNFHQPRTFWAPLIVSGGADKDIGLRDPSDVLGRLGELSDPWIDRVAWEAAHPGFSAPIRGENLDDNITSMNIRAGGK